MKRDDKKVMSFRFSDHILDKIDYLAEEDSQEMKTAESDFILSFPKNKLFIKTGKSDKIHFHKPT